MIDDYKKIITRSCFFQKVWLCRFLSFFILTLLAGGCADKLSDRQNEMSNLVGQHILVVINKFNRNPDVIEDWSDYKRYTWQSCKTQDMSALGRHADGAYYLKPNVICCNIEFDTDRNNLILGSKGLDICPVIN